MRRYKRTDHGDNVIFDFSVYRGFLALWRQNAGRIQIKFTYSDDLSHLNLKQIPKMFNKALYQGLGNMCILEAY